MSKLKIAVLSGAAILTSLFAANQVMSIYQRSVNTTIAISKLPPGKQCKLFGIHCPKPVVATWTRSAWAQRSKEYCDAETAHIAAKPKGDTTLDDLFACEIGTPPGGFVD